MTSMINKKVAIEHGQFYAKSTFKDMLNVNFQGESFSWDDFPKMFAGICAATLFTSYGKTPKNIKELEVLAVEALMKQGQKEKEEYLKTQKLPLKIT